MKKFLSFLLATSVVLSSSAIGYAKDYPQKFWDVSKEHWAFEYIADLAERGVITGYEDGSFKPEKTVTRAEWAKIMVDSAGILANDNSVNFTDTANHWANKYINAAKNYLTGYVDGSYRPNQAAVREDVTVAMVALKGYDVSDVDYSVLSKFNDVNSISDYAKKYVAVAIEKELIQGFEDNTFKGQGTLTRAQAAKLLYVAFQQGSADKIANTSQHTQQYTISYGSNGMLQIDNLEIDDTTQEEDIYDNYYDNYYDDYYDDEEIEEEIEKEIEEEIEEEQKPYAIDKIVSANITDSYLYTKDDNDNIYYCDNNCIYKTNIYDPDKDLIADAKDFIIDNDEMTLSDFNIYSICYDNNKNEILVTGQFKSVNSVNNVNNCYLCSVSNDGFEVITDNFEKGYSSKKIIKVLNNGDYLTAYGDILSADTFDSITDTNTYPIDAFDFDTTIYLTSGVELYSYDYNKASNLWNKYYKCIGINDNLVATYYYNAIELLNFKGKVLEKISFDDVVIYDRAKLDFNYNVFSKLLITNKKEIVFYDKVADSFRIIMRNE